MEIKGTTKIISSTDKGIKVNKAPVVDQLQNQEIISLAEKVSNGENSTAKNSFAGKHAHVKAKTNKFINTKIMPHAKKIAANKTVAIGIEKFNTGKNYLSTKVNKNAILKASTLR